MRRRIFEFNNSAGSFQPKLPGIENNILSSYALNQLKNITIVKDCAKKSRLKLKRFITDENLELYFDVYRKNRNVCFLAKGWDDPGFRIGEIIKLDKNNPKFNENFYRIFELCSKDLISLGFFRQTKDYLWLSLEVGIYYDGFNAKVFMEAAATLRNCINRIKSILKLKGA